ncbi:MAG TPA: hypothetical protein VNC79_01895, partial [Mycobacteriales bacterium]|nr:hypothetical protein [Mycobacteriales bacterium]
RTMLVGPRQVLVAARLDMNDRLDAAGVEDSTDGIEADLRERFPGITEVYLDVTSRGAGGRRQVAESTPEPSSPSSTSPSATR